MLLYVVINTWQILQFMLFWRFATSLKADYQILTREKGSSVTLTCIRPKNLIGPPTVMWQKQTNGELVDIAASVSGIPHISSVSFKGRASLLRDGNLTVSTLSLSDSGIYVCTVTPIRDLSYTSSMELIVTAAPLVTAKVVLNPIVDSDGSYIAATCNARFGKPKPRLSWINRYGELQSSRNFSTRNADDSWSIQSDLLLRPGLSGRSINLSHPVSTEEKSQNFDCRVEHENLFNQDVKTVTIKVLFSPISHISLLGNQLTCHAEGNPLPSIKWYLPNGHVVKDSRSLFLGQTETDNGRYTCLASSSLKPDSVETIDVHKTNSLPVLFRTMERLHTSLPTTASGYEIACSAEIREVQSDIFSVGFEWKKNDVNIDKKLYKISTRFDRSNQPNFIKLISVLRFISVVRGRDDALFQCRLVNRTMSTGFVSAVERTINITVDYSPILAKIKGKPHDFVITEGNTLNLNCSSVSQPPSSYEWYYNGIKISSGSSLCIMKILRSETGIYRCRAYNYVPGASYDEVLVKVLYPPSNVTITKLNNGKLSCSSGGSLPAPIYSWIYSNGSVVRGNSSTIKLLEDPLQNNFSYTCSVTNNLGIIANATYHQSPAVTKRIGVLTVPQFLLTLIGCIAIGLAFSVCICWKIYQSKKSKSRDLTSKKTSKKSFIYRVRNVEQLSNWKFSSISREDANKSLELLETKNKTANKPPVLTSDEQCNGDRYVREDEESNLNNTSVVKQPPSSCIHSIRELTSPQSHSTKTNPRSFSDVDGTSVEITAIESLQSAGSSQTSEEPKSKNNDRKTCEKNDSEEVILEVRPNQTIAEQNQLSDEKKFVNLPRENKREDVRIMVQPQPIASNSMISRSHYNHHLPLHETNHRSIGCSLSPYYPTTPNPLWRSIGRGRNLAIYSTPESDANRIQFVPELFTHDEEEMTNFKFISQDSSFLGDKNLRTKSLSFSSSSYYSLPSQTNRKFYSEGEATILYQALAGKFKKSSNDSVFRNDSSSESGNTLHSFSAPPSKKHQSTTLV